MELMDFGINHTAVKQTLSQLQKKMVNAGRKVVSNTAQRTDTGEHVPLRFLIVTSIVKANT